MCIQDQKGYTLIEVMVSIVIIGLLTGPIFSMISGGIFSAETASNKTVAVSLAQAKLEELKAARFNEIRNRPLCAIEDPVEGYVGYRRITEITELSQSLLEINITITWQNNRLKVTTLRSDW